MIIAFPVSGLGATPVDTTTRSLKTLGLFFAVIVSPCLANSMAVARWAAFLSRNTSPSAAANSPAKCLTVQRCGWKLAFTQALRLVTIPLLFI
jgi:hypothetical protein